MKLMKEQSGLVLLLRTFDLSLKSYVKFLTEGKTNKKG